jgi:uncharacterized damage-inducible protein DinB
MEPKDTLLRYLTEARSALLSRLDGLDERGLRWPMTPTGSNLLGLVKHVASVELGYFGEVFDRPSGEALPWMDEDAEPDADFWATPAERSAEILALARRAAAHTEATVAALDLDAPGRVPWWHPDRQQVTLHQVLVHQITETARHAGHADIIRELLDGAAGDDRGNLSARSPEEWAAYRERLEQVATAAAEQQR